MDQEQSKQALLEIQPLAVFPNIVGRHRRRGIMNMFDSFKQIYVGDEAQAKRGLLNLTHPLPIDGHDINFEDMQIVWNHTFYNECRVTPEEHPLIVSSLNLMDDESYRKMSISFFEEFQVPYLYICDTSLFSLISSGRSNGCVLESGHGITRSCCYVEGFPVDRTLKKMEREQYETRVAGDLVTEHLCSLLDLEKLQIGLSLKTPALRRITKEIIRDVKEKLCFVSCLEKEDPIVATKTYELPDGSTMDVSSERYQAPEILFRPSLINRDGLLSVPELVDHSISSLFQESQESNSGDDLVREMYSSIILSGGNTLFHGFSDRLENELRVIQTKKNIREKKIRVVAPPERKYSVWIGASILSSLSSFQQEWVSRTKFEEAGGDSVMKRYCSTRVIWEKRREWKDLLSLKKKLSSDIDGDERYTFVKDWEKDKFEKILQLDDFRISVFKIHFLVSCFF